MIRLTPSIALAIALTATVVSADQQCRPFHEIYTSGKEVCENMWDGAFEYTEDLDKAYTMWFYGENPNDAVSKLLWGKEDHEQCHLSYYHKESPSPEEDSKFSECHPWRENACCSADTLLAAHKEDYGGNEKMLSSKVLKEMYGPEYHWDRCGPLSPACERFFVEEACFYECEPHAGMYRKYAEAAYNDGVHGGHAYYQGDDHFDNSTNENHSTWQLHKMPIRADYCDAWYNACYHDLFCSVDNGSFFSCAATYKAASVDDLTGQVEALQGELEESQTKLEDAAKEFTQLQAEMEQLKGEAGQSSTSSSLRVVVSLLATVAPMVVWVLW